MIGLPDAKWIERVYAVVVPRADADTAALAEDLTAFGRERLATFKISKQVELIDALPKEPERQDPQTRATRPRRRLRTRKALGL